MGERISLISAHFFLPLPLEQEAFLTTVTIPNLKKNTAGARIG